MQARSIVGDGFRTLKRGFWRVNFKVMAVAMDFPVANVRLETSMRLLNGDGMVRSLILMPYGTVPC